MVDLVPVFRCHDMNRDVELYFHVTFTVMRDRTASFRSAMCNIVETPSPTPCQDVLSILTSLYGGIQALTFNPPVMTSSDS